MSCQVWEEEERMEGGRLAGSSSWDKALQPRSFQLQGTDTFWEWGDVHFRAFP